MQKFLNNKKEVNTIIETTEDLKEYFNELYNNYKNTQQSKKKDVILPDIEKYLGKDKTRTICFIS